MKKNGIKKIIAISLVSIFLISNGSIITADEPLDSPPDKEWIMTFDGDVKDVIPTTDDGYLVALDFNLSQTSYNDIKIVKINSDGETEWAELFDGPSNGNDMICNCEQTDDGGYLLFGNTEESPNSRSYDAWFIKIDSSGNMEWDQIIGYSNNDEKISEGIITSDGYIAVGSIETDNGNDRADVWLVKINDNQKLWDKTYDLLQTDSGKSICQSNGEYVLLCDANYIGALYQYNKAYIIKTDSNGNKLDEVNYPSNTENKYHYFANSIIQLSSGDYIIAGNWMKITLGEQYGYYWLWKVDENLNSVTTKTIGSGNEQVDLFNEICVTSDGNVCAIGTHTDISGNSGDDCMYMEIYKFNTNLDQIWNEVFSEGINGVSVEKTFDQSLVASGTFFSQDQQSSKVIKYKGEINVDISFSSGWNLVSIPVDVDWSASDLKDALSYCQYVVKWKSDSQSWQWYTGQGFDFSLEPDYGYFVYVSNDETLSVSGTPVDGVNVPLKVGWNLLGWYQDYDTSASDIKDCISGCQYVVKWKPDSQSWQWYTGQGFDFSIYQDMGFFSFVTEDSIWYGDC